MKLLSTYGVLHAVYQDGAYLSVLLGRGVDPFTEQLSNLVLERWFYYWHAARALSKQTPRPKVRLVLMMGFAMLDKMRKPPFAVVNDCVSLVKELKLFETGYVNATLKRFAEGERPVLSGDALEEAEWNAPQALIKLVKRDYPKAFRQILAAEHDRRQHVCLRRGVSEAVFDGIAVEKSPFGYFVDPSPYIQTLFQQGKLTYQSLTSAYAVAAMEPNPNDKILDVCAAPGGKSVRMAEFGAEVTACDIHPHRVELIKSYAARMGVDLEAVVKDGTLRDEAYCNAFDKVLVDAPCSGLGVLGKRKDIILRRTAEDVVSLAALQTRILENVAQYVKPGGTLIYSTCTVLKAENTEIVTAFLAQHTDFALSTLDFGFENPGEVQFLPNGKGLDGFYIAKMKRQV